MPVTIPPAYYKLVRKFPLTRIRDEGHLIEAQEVLDDLLARNLDEGGEAYLDALIALIENYETEYIVFPDVTAGDVLRELVRSSGLSQQQLAKAVGIAQSTLSAIINGTRKPTADHMKKLANHFGVSPSVFLAVE